MASVVSMQAASRFESPNRNYSAVIDEDEFGEQSLTVVRGEKELFGTVAGYGGFIATSWSPNSNYLAVVEHGTKTTMTLAVFFLDGDEVTAVNLPDFRLNILGRYHRIVGGRYAFDESLVWKDKSTLQFATRGSLVDGASNATDHPNNWYDFKITVGFASGQARLLLVVPIEENGAGQSAIHSK